MGKERKSFIVPLVVLGCDFRCASTMWREKLVLNDDEQVRLYKELSRLDPRAGIASLITCNRSEWIASADEPGWVGELLKSRIIHVWRKLSAEYGYTPSIYLYLGKDATRYIYEVATGLRSFVAGERQIARQFHMAMKRARDLGTSTKILNGLDKIAGALLKKLGERGILKGTTTGIHSVTVRYIERNFVKRGSSTGKCKGRVAVVGMGEIGKKVYGLLEKSGNWKVIPFNRTLRSHSYMPLARIKDELRELDGIVFCTSSHSPLISIREIYSASGGRRGRDLWVVDIGVPAQVEADGKIPSRIKFTNLDRLVAEPSELMDRSTERMVQLEIDRAVEDFEIFCKERSLEDFLSISQMLHIKYIREIIPEFVDRNFSHLSPADRKTLVVKLRRLFMDYSSSLIEGFHRTV